MVFSSAQALLPIDSGVGLPTHNCCSCVGEVESARHSNTNSRHY